MGEVLSDWLRERALEPPNGKGMGRPGKTLTALPKSRTNTTFILAEPMAIGWILYENKS
jgi:hypothetical protein